MAKKKNEILPARSSKAETEPERRLARSLFSTAVREATSPSSAPKAAKARREATRWIHGCESDGPFSFGNVVDYVFEGVSHERLRDRIDDLAEDGVPIVLDDDFDL